MIQKILKVVQKSFNSDFTVKFFKSCFEPEGKIAEKVANCCDELGLERRSAIRKFSQVIVVFCNLAFVFYHLPNKQILDSGCSS